VFPLKDNIPTERVPIMTIALILANVVMYLLYQEGSLLDLGGGGLDQARLTEYSAIPYELTHPGEQCVLDAGAIACGPDVDPGQTPTLVTLFSAMFAHGGVLHLAGNMLFLWIFGNNVEDAMGRVKFLIFYLGAGLAAMALQVAIDPSSPVPTLGASGAVAGVLGGYILLYPRARVLTVIFIVLFFTLIEIPAILVLGFWFVQQIIFGVLGLSDPVGGGGGVAYFAHIGGFVFGIVLIKLFATRRNPFYEGRSPRHPVY
jgi:membrane associated rhomboid family serine protease